MSMVSKPRISDNESAARGGLFVKVTSELNPARPRGLLGPCAMITNSM
jgi:hypothetical protein